MASSPEALPGVSGEAELGQFIRGLLVVLSEAERSVRWSRGHRNPVLTPHVVFVLGAGA